MAVGIPAGVIGEVRRTLDQCLVGRTEVEYVRSDFRMGANMVYISCNLHWVGRIVLHPVIVSTWQGCYSYSGLFGAVSILAGESHREPCINPTTVTARLVPIQLVPIRLTSGRQRSRFLCMDERNDFHPHSSFPVLYVSRGY